MSPVRDAADGPELGFQQRQQAVAGYLPAPALQYIQVAPPAREVFKIHTIGQQPGTDFVLFGTGRETGTQCFCEFALLASQRRHGSLYLPAFL